MTQKLRHIVQRMTNNVQHQMLSATTLLGPLFCVWRRGERPQQRHERRARSETEENLSPSLSGYVCERRKPKVLHPTPVVARALAPLYGGTIPYHHNGYGTIPNVGTLDPYFVLDVIKVMACFLLPPDRKREKRDCSELSEYHRAKANQIC